MISYRSNLDSFVALPSFRSHAASGYCLIFPPVCHINSGEILGCTVASLVAWDYDILWFAKADAPFFAYHMLEPDQISNVSTPFSGQDTSKASKRPVWISKMYLTGSHGGQKSPQKNQLRKRHLEKDIENDPQKVVLIWPMWSFFSKITRDNNDNNN